MPRLEAKRRSAAAEQLKRVARHLFAERGVDGVTVREIAEAAGQKNHAAVGYHFGSKEALIREIVIDGARLIDERRNRRLDALEAEGGPRTVAEVVDVLIYPSLNLTGRQDEESYNRFVVMLNMTHRQLFLDTLGGRWNSGYLRCLKHLRRLMPDMTPAQKNQRLAFAGAYLGGVLAARESQLARTDRNAPSWKAPGTLKHFAATLVAVLECPPPGD